MNLRAYMDTLVFTPCFYDVDVWMRRSNHGDGTAYFEYVLLYFDDCLVISDNAESFIRGDIGNYF